VPGRRLFAEFGRKECSTSEGIMQGGGVVHFDDMLTECKRVIFLPHESQQ
jgi:hypothetical protein